MKNLLKEVYADEYPTYSKGAYESLHLLIQNKCHRVPLDDTIKELINPSGILYSEYKRIQKLYSEYKEIQEELLKEATLNESTRIN